MRCVIFHKTALVFGTLAALVVLLAAGRSLGAPRDSATKSAKLPPFEAVKRTVADTLAKDKSYRPGDLLSQGRLANVLGRLRSAGWEVSKSRELNSRTLADSDFLVHALSSESGVKFMRQVSPIPDGFEKLDRLARIPNGEATVQRLIAGPDGYKFISYLAETPAGHEMGRMLAATSPDGQFNRDTGRIYTEKQLLQELQKLYAEDMQRN
jgi:hypothetical protein